MFCFPSSFVRKMKRCFGRDNSLTKEDLLGNDRDFYERIRKETENQFRQNQDNSRL